MIMFLLESGIGSFNSCQVGTTRQLQPFGHVYHRYDYLIDTAKLRINTIVRIG